MVRQRYLRMLLAMTLGLGLLFTQQPQAQAAVFCDNPHCYAKFRSNSTGLSADAVTATFQYSCMNGALITQQVWLQNHEATYWIEAGIYQGGLAGGAGTMTTPTYFWGRLAPDTGGYHTWKTTAWGVVPKNAPVNIAIVRNSGGAVWQIFQGGRLMGQGNAPSMTFWEASAGAESTDAKNQNAGSASQIRTKYNGATAWSSGIGPNSTLDRIPNNGYFYINQQGNDYIFYDAPSVSGASGC